MWSSFLHHTMWKSSLPTKVSLLVEYGPMDLDIALWLRVHVLAKFVT